MSSLCISTHLIQSSRQLLFWFFQFLYKYYDGFPIYNVAYFGPQEICRQLISGIFWSKSYKFQSRNYSGLGNANAFCANRWNTIQVSAVLWLFLPNLFGRPSFVKKAENFEFFSNTFDIPHCPLRFVIVTFVFYEPICKISLLIG